MRLANPLSAEQPYLRTTLLPGLLSAALRNLSRGSTDLALFEHGRVFFAHGRQPAAVRPSVAQRPQPDELAALEDLLPDQPEHLALVLTGDWSPAGWWGPARQASWAEAIAGVRGLAAGLGVQVRVDTGRDPAYHPGRCAQISVAADVIGFAGELHPRVITALGLPPRTAAAEVNLTVLIAQVGEAIQAPTVGTRPLAKEDVALIVHRSIPAAVVAEALRKGAGELLESVRLFDQYHGPQVGADQKSLAFSLRFRAPDRTLKAEEVAAARQAAVARAASETGAVQR